MISETKIDGTFSKENFLTEGFSTPYRLDRNTKSWGYHFICKRGYTL